MVEKKPSYDDLLKENRLLQAWPLVVNSMLCIIGFLFYVLALTIIFEFAWMGMTYVMYDSWGWQVVYIVCQPFLVLYGIWHLCTRLIDIWSPELEEWFEWVFLFIERFFRVQVRAFNSLKGDEKKALKKDQTVLEVK